MLLTHRALARLQQKNLGIVIGTENRVLRLRPEISILPALNTAAK